MPVQTTPDSVTVSFDPSVNSQQGAVIPGATVKRAGAMTAEQVKLIAALALKTTVFSTTTTNGTQTTIGTIVSTGDGAFQFQIRGVASDDGAANAACFNDLTFAFIVSGGIVTAMSTPSQLSGNPNTGVGAAYVIDLVMNGGNIDVKVTGFAGTTVRWKVQVDLVFTLGPGDVMF